MVSYYNGDYVPLKISIQFYNIIFKSYISKLIPLINEHVQIILTPFHVKVQKGDYIKPSFWTKYILIRVCYYYGGLKLQFTFSNLRDIIMQSPFRAKIYAIEWHEK